MSPLLSQLYLRTLSDDHLVRLARAGHDLAFGAIVERYRHQLLGYARRVNRGSRAEEDLVQQAFLSAFAALRAGAEVQHLRGWLYQILRNTATRTHGGPTEIELDPAMVVGEALEESVDRRIAALTALSDIAQLPGPQREALVQTAIQGRSGANVARAMGLSQDAVRQLVRRARVNLKTRIGALVPLPLARWSVTARSTSGAGRTSDVAVGAGAVSAGGALKVSALVASTVAVTGVTAFGLHEYVHSRASVPRRAVARAHVKGESRAQRDSDWLIALPTTRLVGGVRPSTIDARPDSSSVRVTITPALGGVIGQPRVTTRSAPRPEGGDVVRLGSPESPSPSPAPATISASVADSSGGSGGGSGAAGATQPSAGSVAPSSPAESESSPGGAPAPTAAGAGTDGSGGSPGSSSGGDLGSGSDQSSGTGGSDTGPGPGSQTGLDSGTSSSGPGSQTGSDSGTSSSGATGSGG